ncbi:MAG: hydrogenase nickel incorporation protein HypA [Cyanobium sp. CACIAM 14]|nr:MAG: hydrogenase nickel incorporation protein HypA [Cyanobium sp. CACIAM 14]
MHELSLMEAVRDLALEQARRHQARRIEGITLQVGSLAGVEIEALRFAHDVVMADTMAAGSRLEIEAVAAACFCSVCRQSFPVLDGCCDCPVCGALSRELLRGRELQLVSLELA